MQHHRAGVWDTGTWEPHDTDDPVVAAGELHADVEGCKLRGRMVLVRRGDDQAKSGQWLLKEDEHMIISGRNLDDYPQSVLNMHRFPGSIESVGFWHKQLPDHAPEWIPRWHDPDAGPERPRPIS